MFIKPDVHRFAKIKVVGLGGGGGNALTSMIQLQQIQGVDFVAVNTDSQALLKNPAENKIQIGNEVTRGLGAGANPEKGRQAAEESNDEIRKALSDSDMVFLTAGMGGGTGTGSIGVVAAIAKELGALTVAVVTKPFVFEGARRMSVAEEGIEELKGRVDALIIIPNQRILDVVGRDTSILDAFKVVDSVLGQGVQGISDLITMPGLINVDFADVRTIMTNAGSALMGIGQGKGENKAVAAAKAAIASPLLELSIEGAKGILFNIVGGPDMSMLEVDEAAKIISQTADQDANIIFGASIDESMMDHVKITVVATGFDEDRKKFNDIVSSRLKKPTMGVYGMPEYNQVPSYAASYSTSNYTSSSNSNNNPPAYQSNSYSKPVQNELRSQQPQESSNTQVPQQQTPTQNGPDTSDDLDIPTFLRKS
ncbi:MAG: cell division protein FtsZ [bacterium]|nr:cell division protein FtsZ [bacterium]